MQEIIKDWFLSYGLLLGKRFTTKQKLKFIKRAKKELENMGYKTEVSQTKISKKGFGNKVYYNLYAGDTDNADVLIYTYYDTPIKNFFANTEFAFHNNYDKKNIILSFLLGIIIILVAGIILINFVQPNISTNGIFSIWGLAFVTLCFVTFHFINKCKYGLANGKNIVRNSSSIIAMMSLAKQLEEAKKSKVCFAFVDEGTSSEIGMRILEKYLPKKKKVKIYLDSVGAKGEIVVLSDKKYDSSHRIDMIEKYNKYGNILLTRGNLVGENIEIQSIDYNDYEAFERKNNEVVEELKIILKQILKI